MPSTVNGVGTHYYGKRNREKNAGVCEHCHQHVELETYETRLWFCVVFIPVIPLGRKQILDDCPSCSMHKAVPFADWEALRNEAIGESASELRENQDDPEAALKMLGTLAAFHRTDEATKLARMMRDRHSDHALVQFSVGGWLEQNGHGSEATACFESAWKIEPDNPGYRRAWGMTLAEQGQLGEARELLSIFEQPESLDPGTLYFLALQCQKHSDHAQAVELFELILGLAPALGKDKDFRKAVRESENAIGGEASILPRRSILSSKAFWWATVACLLVIGVFATSRFIALNRTVYLVNGAEVPISVSINDGPAVRIAQLSRTAIKLPEDAHTWALTEPPELVDQGNFEVSTGFLSRLFDSPVFVLDPGRTTVTVYEHATYAERVQDARVSTRVHAGQLFLIFDDVDLAFEQFPEQIRGERSDMERTRVDSLLYDPSAVIGAVQNDITPDQQLQFCERHLTANPSNENLLEMYVFLAFKLTAGQRMHDFLQKGTERRPIEISWHRMYQSAATNLSRDKELFAEYDRILETDPGDSSLLYLRGRIEPNSTRAGSYYDRAIAADPNNVFPLMAKAHRSVSLAHFAEARAAADRALAIEPDNNVERVRFWSRIALGDLDALEKESRAALATEPLNANAHFRLLSVLALQNRIAQVKQAHDAYALSIKTRFSRDPYGSIPQSERFVAICEGDYEKALQVTRRMAQSAVKSQLEAECLVELKRFDELQNVTFNDLGTRGFAELFETVEQMTTGEGARWVDLEASQRALKSLRQANSECQMVADLLVSGADNPDELYEGVIGITLQPQQRIVVCLAAATQASGETRTRLLDLAEELNFMPSYPFGITKSFIADLR